MGFSGMSFGSLLLILLIAMLIFGTKRMRNIGEDLGAAIKSFRKGMEEGENSPEPKQVSDNTDV